MIKKRILLTLGFIFIFLTNWAQVRQPEYPLFGILVSDPALKDMQNVPKSADLSQMNSARLIYTSHLPNLRILRDARKMSGNGPSLIVYMGGFTTNPGGATEIEQGFRGATAMIDITTLALALDASSNSVSLVLPANSELAIKASTADLTDPKDISKYCFWIRIDDELMQVKSVDTVSGLLQVKRGLDSKAVTHAKGAIVFTPVYVGNRNQLGALRHTNSWPGGPDYLRYALDPRSTAAQDYKASVITELIKNGYDGSWLDTFQGYKLYNLCDALGRPVTQYYDFSTKRRYVPDVYFLALQSYIRGIRTRVIKATQRNPVIVANNVSGTYEFGGKSLFRTAANPDLLDGYCFEDSYLRIGAATTRGGNVLLAAGKNNIWVRNLISQSDAANNGLNAYNMIAMAGYVAGYLNQRQPDYDRLIRFGYGSFLLTVTKERTTLFGLPLFLTEIKDKPALVAWPEIIFAPIGDPIDGTFNVANKVTGGEYYQRSFTNGLVIVNPDGAKPVTVTLKEGYVDWQSRKPVSTVNLVSGDAALFLRQSKK
jgi:hypothetical protein